MHFITLEAILKGWSKNLNDNEWIAITSYPPKVSHCAPYASKTFSLDSFILNNVPIKHQLSIYSTVHQMQYNLKKLQLHLLYSISKVLFEFLDVFLKLSRWSNLIICWVIWKNPTVWIYIRFKNVQYSLVMDWPPGGWNSILCQAWSRVRQNDNEEQKSAETFN